MAKIAPSAIALALCLLTAHAAADEPTPAPTAPPSNAERADALFQEGKRLFEAGKIAEACGRFAESDALDPTVSALGLLAGCHERQGKLVAAWKEYREAERRGSATGDTRAAFARDRAAALEARLPRLTISLAKPTQGIEILRNEGPVPPEEIGVDVPVDAGTFEIVARAPGRQEFRTTVTTKEGARETVLVPELEPIKVRAIAPPETPKPPPPDPRNTRVSAALVTGGLGLTGLGVGIALGASASSQNTASNALYALCERTRQKSCPEGRQVRDGALRLATGSTIGFSVGLAGLGISTVLLLIPSRKAPARSEKPAFQVTPQVGPQGGGAALAGRF